MIVYMQGRQSNRFLLCQDYLYTQAGEKKTQETKEIYCKLISSLLSIILLLIGAISGFLQHAPHTN
jgi:hypothetical protein